MWQRQGYLFGVFLIFGRATLVSLDGARSFVLPAIDIAIGRRQITDIFLMDSSAAYFLLF